jgi:tetratricopeptide (TPR) repeat protein
MFLHGDLVRAQTEAAGESQRWLRSSPEWSWKFKTLEAEAMLWRGLYEDALNLLKSRSLPFKQPDLAIHALTLIGVADASLHRFPEAEQNIKEAEEFCRTSAYVGCGEVVGARGFLTNERGDSSSAEKFFMASLTYARVHGDRFLESKALRNLGHVSAAMERFDEAIDRSEASYEAAAVVDARVVELVAKANIGWADYRLGDREKALEAFQEAEKRAADLGDIYDQENELTNIGYVYMDESKFDLAGQSFRQALKLAESIKAQQDIYNALRVLARFSLRTGDLERASHYAERARGIARESGIHKDELYPMLVQGQVAARRGNSAEAEKTFQVVEQDRACPVFLKWEAQHSLARLYEDQKRLDVADREYRAALATFEAARASVGREDYQLSFLSNAAGIYDDYVHFLVARGRTGDALRWADYSRARTLAEGLGLLPKGASKGDLAAPPALNAQEIARRAKGTLLFYWLGEKQSYLWAVTPQRTQLFSLPPGAEIEAAVQRYRKALGGPQDVLDSANEDGRRLYSMLIAPAAAVLPMGNTFSPAKRKVPSGAKAPKFCAACGAAESRTLSKQRGLGVSSPLKIFVIPDGGLNNLNFETLIVPDPQPHYWIEDATIANASSLRVLAASQSSPVRRTRRLLLVGDSVAPSKDYPELPKASVQMESVARHFPAEQRQIFARAEATPAAYLGSPLERFSYIHFVAHGTASRLSPLDSAIVLSRDRANGDSFKLYARDIIRHRLRADLVTISACYGAGERAYSGEGLVGLSWAFQRAGAHHVIAALWEATDASSLRLMEEFYGQLEKGAGPDSALRSAKLALLHGSSFHNPFYWAPFQLYAGSGT